MVQRGGAAAASDAPRGAQRCRVVGRGTAWPYDACVRLSRANAGRRERERERKDRCGVLTASRVWL